MGPTLRTAAPLAVALVGACAKAVPSPAALAAAAAPALVPCRVAVPAGEALIYRVTAGPFDGGRVELIAGAGPADGERDSWVEARFDPRDAAIEVVQRTGSTVVRRRQAVPGGAALNIYSALYVLRAWSRAPAGSATVDVLARSRLWRATVRSAGREIIATESGPVRVVRLDGVGWRTRLDGSPDSGTEARRFRLYFSADADRRPVRIELDARFAIVRAELLDDAESSTRRHRPATHAMEDGRRGQVR